MDSLKPYERDFGWSERVLNNKPALRDGEDLRDLPTYTIPEAARFLGVPRRTMSYWFSSEVAVLKPSLYVGDIALLTFRDASEAYVLELLRSFYGFPLATLRRVMDNFNKETSLSRPLLEADLTVVLGNLVMKKPARGNQPVRMVDLAHERNLVFPELVKMIGLRVLSDNTRSPYRIYPWRKASTNDESQPVSMSPDVMSGRLVVTGTRIPVTSIVGLKLSGKSTQQIARSYNLSVESVEKAIEHFERPILTKTA